MSAANEGQSFWDHLDELRTVLIRIAVAVLGGSIVAFCLKQPLFELVLAPNSPDFITYKLLNRIAQWAGSHIEDMASIKLINTGLAQQFVLHMKMAFSMGTQCVSPYIIYQLFRFVSPAFYSANAAMPCGWLLADTPCSCWAWPWPTCWCFRSRSAFWVPTR